MLSRKVIATQITNLTDARYFAARGVDYLLFEMSKTSIEQALEIKEWVEGPHILLLFDDSSLKLLDEAIIKIKPVGIAGIDNDTTYELSHLSAHVDIFQWSEGILTFADQDFKHVINLSDLDGLDRAAGVIVMGGTEEDIGIKAFDDLDELLDALES